MKKELLVKPALAILAFTLLTFSCNDPESDIEQPVIDPVEEDHGKLLAGEWKSNVDKMGMWVIDEDGHVQVLSVNVDIVLGGIDNHRDSTIVKASRVFDLDFNPTDSTVTITEDGVSRETKVIKNVPDTVHLKDFATEDTIKLVRKGEFCSESPESLEGLYLFASRYKVHGIKFAPEGVAMQYFYYDEMVDPIVSRYEYTRLEGNKAHISYDISYRLNSEKQQEELGGSLSKYPDATFELRGELDLTFLSHSVSKYDERYFGEMEGNVVAILTNNKTGKKTTSKIGGRRYFGMSSVDDDY